MSGRPADPGHTERWLSIVGIGEDGVAGLSPAAAAVIGQARLVIGGRRHLALAAPLIVGESLAWTSPLDATVPMILGRRGRPTCVLATGDPFHFGIGATLVRHVPADEIACYPQPSAFSLAAARLGWPLQECTCVSLHGRALDSIVPHLRPGQRLLALSWDGTTPAQLADLLCRHGLGASIMTVCEAMGGAAERLRTVRAQDFALGPVADLNTIAVALADVAGSRGPSLVPGRPDALFEHDGQITKSPIRAVTLAALAPRPGETLWDIGGGSGAVTIEWLLAGRDTRAITIEKQPDRMARLRRNAERWGVADRVTAREGEAPDCLADLPLPDAIFIGGGLTAPGLLEACCSALAPGGRLVANAVTLEGQAVLAAALQTRGGALLTLAVAWAEPVGGFHGLRPAMPVTQWRWDKP